MGALLAVAPVIMTTVVGGYVRLRTFLFDLFPLLIVPLTTALTNELISGQQGLQS